MIIMPWLLTEGVSDLPVLVPMLGQMSVPIMLGMPERSSASSIMHVRRMFHVVLCIRMR